MVLEEVLELHDVAVAQRLVDHDFRLQLLLRLPLAQALLGYHFGRVPQACFFGHELVALCESSLCDLLRTLPSVRPLR